jgi:hypothetical protein
MRVMTLVTVVCGGFLTLVLISSGAGYFRFEGTDEGAKRAVVKLICDSVLEPIAVGSCESVRVMEVSSRTMLRGL